MPVRRSVYLDRLAEFASFTFDDATAPLQRGRWADFFRKRIGDAFSGRIILEIGCNDATLLSSVATSHADVGFVGLDWKAKAIYDGAATVAMMGLNNVALVRHRAQDIESLFAPQEIDEIWVFHPDPCDRDVELPNRLIAEPFLRSAHRILRDEASVLSLKTDHAGYYQWVLAQLGLPQPDWFTASDSNSPRVRRQDLLPPDALPPRNAAILERFDVTSNSADFWNDAAVQANANARPFAQTRTPFETRFIRKKQPIYFLELRKK